MHIKYNIYIQMLVNKIARTVMVSQRILMRFSGGHHHVYDWRDDKSQNKDIYDDPQMVGVRTNQTYEFPHQATPQEIPNYIYSHPKDYNPKDLTKNMVGDHIINKVPNNLEVPTSDYLNDAAHEMDYYSQDLDFQPQSFKYQHFRKQGPIWMWVIGCTAPLWFFFNELFHQFWPDADNWRYQRPPPLNYPDDTETPDTEYYNMFKSQSHKDFYDAGIVNAPFFDIIDGKKVYTKWAGVNQPREHI